MSLTDKVVTATAIVRCSACGIAFAVPENWFRARKNDHKTWWCPNGDRQHFPGKTEADKLRERLEQEKRCCELNRARAAHLDEQVEHRERQIRGYRGALAKAKKRSKVMS